MKQLTLGILAHVDSGKTTLSEALLYNSGAIRSIGRVDHKNAYLDTHSIEKDRGITIFSKQAVFSLEKTKFYLLDTPGHVDFSSEMERTLQVLDYAILVISGTDGIQSHTQTLWTLLNQYEIPTFIFVNKMEIDSTNKDALLQELKDNLSESCVDFSSLERDDNLAVCSESLLNQYLEEGQISNEYISSAIKSREVFPCFFGSALKMIGIDELINAMDELTLSPNYRQEFGARVYKISTDKQGNRLTHLKITGGNLKVRETLTGSDLDGNAWQEKINQIRVYSGLKFDSFDEIESGTVCAVTGLTSTYSGQGLGYLNNDTMSMLEPVLSYSVILPIDVDVTNALKCFKILEQEDPQLHISWNEQLKSMQLQLMGAVQIEILQTIVKERFGFDVAFDSGKIVYRETIEEQVYGAGHFEPLKHYAEVHIRIEPLERGRGIVLESECLQDDLTENWQHLILTHLGEKKHTGPLTNSPITDVKITVVNGRSHIKHTEGGDFREATYRALRHGLMKAKMVLLEPYYNFKVELPTESLGRLILDVGQMGGSYEPPDTKGDISILRGFIPVSTSRDYQRDLISYTRGQGRLTLTVRGYDICHNTEEVVKTFDYDATKDLETTGSSVFCSHGSGYNVPWYNADSHMHVKLAKKKPKSESVIRQPRSKLSITDFSEKELLEIFEKTYGPIKARLPEKEKKVKTTPKEEKQKPVNMLTGPEYLLVDGYNIIFAWKELTELAKESLDYARGKLMDIMCNHCAFKKCNLILVFDAYKVKGNRGSVEQYHNITVVYTKEAETADMYIEKTTHQMGKKNKVRVATSDRLEQMIILGHGALRVSARAFEEEVKASEKELRTILESQYIN